MAETDSLRQVAQARAPFSTWLGILLLFVVFGAIVLALVGPSSRKDTYEAARAKKRVDNLSALRTEDAKTLSAYAWVDQAKGTVRIPIDRAMQLTVAELARKKPAPAYAIVVVPSAPAAPAAAPSAAPKNGANPTPAQAPPSQTSSNTNPTPAPHANEPEGPKSENRSQPAGAANPPNPQTGASAIPMPSPAAGRPAVSPTGTPNQKSAAPLPVPGTTPTP